MNVEKLIQFAAGFVFAAAVTGNLNRFNDWTRSQTAKALRESQASTWGSPRFWPDHKYSTLSPEIKKVSRDHMTLKEMKNNRQTQSESQSN